MYDWHVGIDEVGRGCLAGPVSVGVCAVRNEKAEMLFSEFDIVDSKKINEKKRYEKADALEKHIDAGDIVYHVSDITADIIDEKGIQYAITTALENALQEVLKNISGSYKVFLDGGLKTKQDCEQETIVRGDGKILSISFASILAKVQRDRYMIEQDDIYEGYGFSAHKGYGTKVHREMIAQKGFTKLHRKSFCKNINIEL
ncbi:MAG: ribonuclease HII [Flavobacteriaceae bacterium]|jgi:ribonuclease HII